MALFSILIHEKMGNRQHKSRVLKLFSIFPYWIFFYVITHLDLIQKQPPEMFCKKRCSQKFHKIHKKTPVPESLFNKVAGLRPATLLKKRLWHRYFKVQPYSYERKTLELWPGKKLQSFSLMYPVFQRAMFSVQRAMFQCSAYI